MSILVLALNTELVLQQLHKQKITLHIQKSKRGFSGDESRSF